MSLERSVARLFAIGFDGLRLPKEAAELIARGVRCVVLFKRNIESPRQLWQLTADIKSRANGEPLAIAIDHEGGRVVRLPDEFTPIPSAREIGNVNDPDLAREIGAIMARELRAVNIDINFAPVLDVDTNPANPVIAGRSFGRDPERVARLGCAMIEGLQTGGVAACGKHFPGHGDTSQDTHFDLPRLDHELARLEKIEMPPFRAAIKSGVAGIMSSHIIFSAIENQLPATMSDKILQGLLRLQLGFEGVIFSDDLEMKAIAANYPVDRVVIAGVSAGLDLLLICRDPAMQSQAVDALTQAVADGVVPSDVITRANERLDGLFSKYVKPSSARPDVSRVGTAAHRHTIGRAVGAHAAQVGEGDPTVPNAG